MKGVINYNKLEKDFLHQVSQKSELEYQECVEYIKARNDIILLSLKDSWIKCLRILGHKYRTLQGLGLTGDLCYGYLSFLRSGVLKQRDWFRMDYYDARDCISEIECGEKLEVTHILLERFNQCQDEIRRLFASQSRVKPYIGDRIIYQFAERYYTVIEPLLLESFYQGLAEAGAELYNTLTVRFFIGELFARTKPAIVWNDIPILNG